MRRRWPPSLASVLGLGFGVWGLGLGVRALDDNSFLTHLATGRLILGGGIPQRDPYSLSAAGEPWVVQSWLASTLYGTVDRWWGGAGLLVMTGLLTAALALAVWALTAPAVSLLPRIAVAAVVVGVGAGVWSERPLLIGLLLFATTLLVTERKVDPRWLVPVMWVWANSHGSFPFGLVALAGLAGGRRLAGERPDRELRALAWATGGVLLAAVNPLGPRLLVFPLELLGRSGFLRHVAEWQPPGFHLLAERLFLVEVVVAVLALARRRSWRQALPMVVFVPAALLASRNIGVASLALVPGLAAGLTGLGTLDGSRRSRPVTVAFGAVAACAARVVASAAVSDDAFDFDRYPTRQLAWLQAEGHLGDEGRIVTTDRVGNYLEAVLGTEADVYFDDRYDMYPSGVLDDYLTLHDGGSGWESVLDDYGATAVLWPRTEPLGELLTASPAWHVVLADERWVVALPRREEGDGP